RGTCSLPVAPSARMISSTRAGSFVGYTPTESPTSTLNPHPARSSSKWRVSFSDSGPLSRRLTSIVAGKGFVREYGGAATVALASVIAAAFSGDLWSPQMFTRHFQSRASDKVQAFFEERFDRRFAFDFSVAGAIAKSPCRLKRSTRATNTDRSSPTLNLLRDRLPMSWRRAGSNT